MENLNILITKETMDALKKKAHEQKMPYYHVAQKILADATNTKCLFFDSKPIEENEKNNTP